MSYNYKKKNNWIFLVSFLILTLSLSFISAGFFSNFVNKLTGQATSVCGDGIIDPGEQCDGTNFGPINDCSGFGLEGTLTCSQCIFDISQCVEPPPEANESTESTNESAEEETPPEESINVTVNETGQNETTFNETVNAAEANDSINDTSSETGNESSATPQGSGGDGGIVTRIFTPLISWFLNLFGRDDGGTQQPSLSITRVSRLINQYQSSPTTNNFGALEQTLLQRKQIMNQLAETSPQEFLNNVLSADMRTSLPLALQSEVEVSVSGQYEINVIHTDTFDQSGGIDPTAASYEFYLADDQNLNRLYTVGTLAPTQSGSVVQFTGYKLGNIFVADANNVQAVQEAPVPSVTGEANVLLVLVGFLDSEPSPYTLQQFDDAMFREGVQSYLHEASYDKILLRGTTLGWYTLDRNGTWSYSDRCRWPSFNEIINTVKDDVNIFSYDRIFMVANFNFNNCRNAGGGWGTVGKITLNINDTPLVASWAASNQGPLSFTKRTDYLLTAFEYVAVHELGHNFGAGHANFLSCPDGVVLGDGCRSFEYGNFLDIMGNSWDNHFSAYFKDIFGWLNSPNEIATIYESDPQNITLFPLELPSGLRAVKIPTAKLTEDGIVNGAFYIEFRRPIGYDIMTRYLENYDGLIINWVQDRFSRNIEGTVTSGKPWLHLLDMDATPGATPLVALSQSDVFNYSAPSGASITIGPILSLNDSQITFIVTGEGDTTPPIVNVTGAPLDWTNTNQTARVTCSDSGAGCDTTSYKYRTYTSYSPTCSTDTSTYTSGSSVTISSHEWVCSYAKDNAGNEAFSGPIEFKIDKTPPIVVIGRLIGLGTVAETATVRCTDLESGCDEDSYRYKIMEVDVSRCPTNLGSYTPGNSVEITSHVWICGYAKNNQNRGTVSIPREFKLREPTIIPNITRVITCSDTDGGRIYSSKGVCISTSSAGTDYCDAGGKIVEYFCADNKCIQEFVNCQAGEICTNGECVDSCENCGKGPFNLCDRNECAAIGEALDIECVYKNRFLLSNTCTAPEESSCSPSCAGKSCGNDGCGGSCGSCFVGFSCNTNGQCVSRITTICTPSCIGKVCGDDGCGGSCGSCFVGFSCNTNGQCVSRITTICTPSCIGKVCGDDGCGGSCGSCSTGNSCTNGNCVSSCNPSTCSSLDYSCGTWFDGCGGIISCGGCSTGFSCVSGSCERTGGSSDEEDDTLF